MGFILVSPNLIIRPFIGDCSRFPNGDRTYIWDDHNYPPREIQGFLKKDELQRLIWRRNNNKPLHLKIPDTMIAGRSYQTEANQNHVAIAKLRRNLPLTETDLTALEEMLFTTDVHRFSSGWTGWRFWRS